MLTHRRKMVYGVPVPSAAVGHIIAQCTRPFLPVKCELNIIVLLFGRNDKNVLKFALHVEGTASVARSPVMAANRIIIVVGHSEFHFVRD